MRSIIISTDMLVNVVKAMTLNFSNILSRAHAKIYYLHNDISFPFSAMFSLHTETCVIA